MKLIEIIIEGIITSYKNNSAYTKEVYKADMTYVIIVSLGIISYNMLTRWKDPKEVVKTTETKSCS